MAENDGNDGKIELGKGNEQNDNSNPLIWAVQNEVPNSTLTLASAGETNLAQARHPQDNFTFKPETLMNLNHFERGNFSLFASDFLTQRPEIQEDIRSAFSSAGIKLEKEGNSIKLSMGIPGKDKDLLRQVLQIDRSGRMRDIIESTQAGAAADRQLQSYVGRTPDPIGVSQLFMLKLQSRPESRKA